MLQPEQRTVMDGLGMTNSDGKHNRLESGRSCMERFVQYHPITVTSNKPINKFNFIFGSVNHFVAASCTAF
jgi:hypothetical protein